MTRKRCPTFLLTTSLILNVCVMGLCAYKVNYLNIFKNYLNSLPNQKYLYLNGALLHSEFTGDNIRSMEFRLNAVKKSDPKLNKVIRCSAVIRSINSTKLVLGNKYRCLEEVARIHAYNMSDLQVTDAFAHDISTLTGILIKMRKKRENTDTLVLNKDPSNSKYYEMASKALQIYLKKQNLRDKYEVVEIQKATESFLGGIMLELHFTISSTNHQDIIKCRSYNWNEKSINKVTSLLVSCDIKNAQNKKAHIFKEYSKDISSKDPTLAKYRLMAEKALQEYVKKIKDSRQYRILNIEKVSEHMVGGIMTKIYFQMFPIDDMNVLIGCRSQIWEMRPQNYTDISITCNKANNILKPSENLVVSQNPDIFMPMPNSNFKCSSQQTHFFNNSFSIGFVLDKDVIDLVYVVAVANQAMQKFLKDADISQPYKVVSITKVCKSPDATMQIHFEISPITYYSVKVCNTTIKELPIKEIDVFCEFGDKQMFNFKENQVKRQRDLKFKALACFSMDNFHPKPCQSLIVQKATEKFIKGTITAIDFTICYLSNKDYEINCHSSVFTEHGNFHSNFSVHCDLPETQVNKNSMESMNKNVSKHNIMQLAESSLQFLKGNDYKQIYEIKAINGFNDEDVDGVLYIIDFNIFLVNKTMHCQSEIWENNKDVSRRIISQNCFT